MQVGVPQCPPHQRRAQPINTNDTDTRYWVTVKLEPKHDRKRSSLVGSRWNQSNAPPFLSLCNGGELHSQAQFPLRDLLQQ